MGIFLFNYLKKKKEKEKGICRTRQIIQRLGISIFSLM